MTTFALFLLLACGGTEAPAPDGDGGEAAETPEPAAEEGGGEEAAAWEAPELEAGMDMCLGAVDCVPVQLSCCNSCDGGAVVAVNKTRADEVKEKFGQKDCEKVQCAGTECTPVEVECAMGCKVKGG